MIFCISKILERLYNSLCSATRCSFVMITLFIASLTEFEISIILPSVSVFIKSAETGKRIIRLSKGGRHANKLLV